MDTVSSEARVPTRPSARRLHRRVCNRVCESASAARLRTTLQPTSCVAGSSKCGAPRAYSTVSRCRQEAAIAGIMNERPPALLDARKLTDRFPPESPRNQSVCPPPICCFSSTMRSNSIIQTGLRSRTERWSSCASQAVRRPPRRPGRADRRGFGS